MKYICLNMKYICLHMKYIYLNFTAHMQALSRKLIQLHIKLHFNLACRYWSHILVRRKTAVFQNKTSLEDCTGRSLLPRENWTNRGSLHVVDSGGKPQKSHFFKVGNNWIECLEMQKCQDKYRKMKLNKGHHTNLFW